MPADGIPLPFAISGDVGTSRPEKQLLIETIRSNAHPKDLILACAEQAIRPKSTTAMSESGQTETLGRIRDWSVHPLTADMPASRRQVSLVPGTEVATSFDHLVGADE
jgi:hypothetical protein